MILFCRQNKKQCKFAVVQCCMKLRDTCRELCIIIKEFQNTIRAAGEIFLYPQFHNIYKLFIIIIIKKGRQCKAEREWYTPYQSEDPIPTIPTYRQKEEKGEKSRRLW